MSRKSFVLHKDSLDVLDELTDEQAGKLFRAIKAYQRGEELELDHITKIVFSSFKNQFERDEAKYQKTCEARAKAGKKGGEKKAEAEKERLANASKCQQELPSDSKSKQDLANLADSDSKSDSDSNNKDLMSDKSDAVEVLLYLNQVVGGDFKPTTKSHTSVINARLKEGYSVEDMKLVVDFKAKEWMNTNAAQYLRPGTLFIPKNFAGYLQGAKSQKGKRDINQVGTDFTVPEWLGERYKG